MDNFLQGVQVGNATLANEANLKTTEANLRQQELTNFIKGFEKDGQGIYRPNERGAKFLSEQNAIYDQKLMILENRNKTIESILNKDSMQEAISHLAMGKITEANNIIKNNPILKDKLASNFNIHKIMPIDLGNSEDLELLRKANFDLNTIMKDSKALNALNSSVYKTIDNKGNVVLRSTQETIKSTNYLGYSNDETKQGIINRFNTISELLAGHITTSDEYKQKQEANDLLSKQRQAESNKIDVVNTQLQSTGNIAKVHSDYTTSILQDTSLSSEQKLAKLNDINTLTLKGKNTEALDIMKAQLDLQSKQLDVKGKQLDNEAKAYKLSDKVKAMEELKNTIDLDTKLIANDKAKKFSKVELETKETKLKELKAKLVKDNSKNTKLMEALNTSIKFNDYEKQKLELDALKADAPNVKLSKALDLMLKQAKVQEADYKLSPKVKLMEELKDVTDLKTKQIKLKQLKDELNYDNSDEAKLSKTLDVELKQVELDQAKQDLELSKDSNVTNYKELKNQLDLELKQLKVEEAKSKIPNTKGNAEFLSNLMDRDKVPYNDENLQKAKAIQGKKVASKALQDIDNRFDIVQATKTLHDRLKASKVNKNAITKIGGVISKVFGSDNVPFTESLDNLERLGLEANLNSIVADYIKNMSGLATTDTERKIYTDIVSGGNWSTKETAVASLGDFLEYIDTSYKNKLASINMPYDQLVRRERYDKWKHSEAKPSKAKPSETKSSEAKPIIDLSSYIKD